MKKMFVVIGNTDSTEGKGHPVLLGLCRLEATARRVANGKGPMGSDAIVTSAELLEADDDWYIAVSRLPLVPATAEDESREGRLRSYREVEKKARHLGLTEDELRALRAGDV